MGPRNTRERAERANRGRTASATDEAATGQRIPVGHFSHPPSSLWALLAVCRSDPEPGEPRPLPASSRMPALPPKNPSSLRRGHRRILSRQLLPASLLTERPPNSEPCRAGAASRKPTIVLRHGLRAGGSAPWQFSITTRNGTWAYVWRAGSRGEGLLPRAARQYGEPARAHATGRAVGPDGGAGRDGRPCERGGGRSCTTAARCGRPRSRTRCCPTRSAPASSPSPSTS